MVQNKYISLRNKLFKGHSRVLLKFLASKVNDGDTKEIKIARYKDVKSFANGNDIADVCDTIKVGKNYNIRCIKKNDIVFPIISALDDIEILYIKEEPQELYLYDETSIVLRNTDTDIDSMYLYLMLNSTPIKNALINQKWLIANSNRGKLKSNRIIPRLTVDLLSHIMIVKLTEDEQREIVAEYNRLNKAQDDFNSKLTKLQTQDKDKSAVIWFQDNKK